VTPQPGTSKSRAESLRSSQRDDWLTSGRFGLLLALLVSVAFPQVVLGLETFVLRDFGLFVYPLAHYQRECFWQGELPFWNPYNNCGVPFLAQWNTMPLYPPALIYLLFPLRWSLSFFDLLHLWFGGLGMYFLAHRWAGNRLASSLAGLVFAFNGLSLNLLMWPSHTATLSWMPWVMLAVEKAWREGGRPLLMAALVGALQMLAGGPETILLTWLMLLALLCSDCLFELKGRARLSSARRFGLVVLLVTALASAQLLPFFDLAAHSQRERGYADTSWSLPARGWANFLVPMAFGSTWNQDVFFQYGQYWTSSYYFGAGTVLLALLAVWTVRERRVWLLAAATVAAFACALGDQTFIYGWLRRLLPQLTLMNFPVKFVTVIIFAGPMLAAFAMARLRYEAEGTGPANAQHSGNAHASGKPGKPQRREERGENNQGAISALFASLRLSIHRGKLGEPRSEMGLEVKLIFLGVFLLVLIAAILLWAWHWPRALDDFPATFRNGLSRAAFLTALVVVLFFLKRRNLPRWQVIFSLLLLLVTWLDLWTHEPVQNPTLPTGIYQSGMVRAELAMEPGPALGQARVMVSPAADETFNRVRMKDLKTGYMAKRLGYFSNCNLLDEAPKVNGFFSLYPRECAELNSLLYGSTNQFPRLEDFLSVAYVTAPGEFTKWEPRLTFLPWVTAGQKPMFLDGTNMLSSLAAPDFDAQQTVFLPVETVGVVSVTNVSNARVLKLQFSTREVTLEVEAPAPALVVISQTYYHDWRAYVNGEPVPLLRANYAFQAVQVPPGKHGVRLIYQDRAFQIGAVLSGLALLGCVGGWIRTKDSSRPSSPSERGKTSATAQTSVQSA
jgi:hypothetical protein